MENFNDIEKKLSLFKSLKPNPSWQAQTRQLLVGEKQSDLVLFSWRKAVLTFAVVIFLTVGSGVLAAESLPGEPFYPIKRAFERARLFLTNKEGQFVISQQLVDARISELKQIVVENDQATNKALVEVESSVAEIKVQVEAQQRKIEVLQREGKDVTEIKESLANFVPAIEAKQEQLKTIEPTLPAERQEQLASVIVNLEAIKLDIRKITLEADPDKDPQDGEIPQVPDPNSTTP